MRHEAIKFSDLKIFLQIQCQFKIHVTLNDKLATV
jgi:hypothetical protein